MWQAVQQKGQVDVDDESESKTTGEKSRREIQGSKGEATGFDRVQQKTSLHKIVQNSY